MIGLNTIIQKLNASSYGLITLSLTSFYQGWRMIRRKRENEEIFKKWAFMNADIRVYGWITISAGLLIFIPEIKFWGELVTAFSLFITISVQLSIRDRSLWLLLPFLLVNLFIMYVQFRAGILL